MAAHLMRNEEYMRGELVSGWRRDELSSTEEDGPAHASLKAWRGTQRVWWRRRPAPTVSLGREDVVASTPSNDERRRLRRARRKLLDAAAVSPSHPSETERLLTEPRYWVDREGAQKATDSDVEYVHQIEALRHPPIRRHKPTKNDDAPFHRYPSNRLSVCTCTHTQNAYTHSSRCIHTLTTCHTHTHNM